MGVLHNPKFKYLLGEQPFYFKFWKTLFYLYSKIVFIFYTPVKVYGRKNIPDTSYIFCSNHNSHMDVALLSASAKKSFNHFGMLAAKDYWFDNWIRKILINTVMNLIPIDRKINGVREFSIKDTLALCQSFMSYNKRCLIFFPEGTRGTPGKISKFKKGASTFAVNLDKPILPAVIFGSHKAWPKDKVFMRPSKIIIHILKPLYPKSFLKNSNPSNSEQAKAIDEMTLKLEQEIKKKASFLYEE